MTLLQELRVQLENVVRLGWNIRTGLASRSYSYCTATMALCDRFGVTAPWHFCSRDQSIAILTEAIRRAVVKREATP